MQNGSPTETEQNHERSERSSKVGNQPDCVQGHYCCDMAIGTEVSMLQRLQGQCLPSLHKTSSLERRHKARDIFSYSGPIGPTEWRSALNLSNEDVTYAAKCERS
jgi:hypothetical protein